MIIRNRFFDLPADLQTRILQLAVKASIKDLLLVDNCAREFAELCGWKPTINTLVYASKIMRRNEYDLANSLFELQWFLEDLSRAANRAGPEDQGLLQTSYPNTSCVFEGI